MPINKKIRSVLIIGAGPIVIGQACEFDYSGVQACKALREEGIRVILVNSNPATIMTDPDMADKVYIEPIHWRNIEKIIIKENPDAILPTMGGQTALNTTLDLNRHKILDKYDVEIIGASVDSIDMAEDRELFKNAMTEIGLETATAYIAHDYEEALLHQKKIGFPVLVRPSFTLGGSGGGIAYNIQDFETIVKRGVDLSPTSEVLIEESVIGWKEFEMEVVRDRNDNCIIICSIENIDPMGVHTGDSITVAPAQTLTDKEYQKLRNASIQVLRKIGVDTGGSNVQFAISPKDGRVLVIEMNPRVSRSSALASKATGFPIAKVAAKLAIGYTLDELRNEITGNVIPASFEPSIDYVVTKIPRFAFEKFKEADNKLTTQMKSVGEVMAIGRNFQESFQKALRGLEIGIDGLKEMSLPNDGKSDFLTNELRSPTPERILYISEAFRQKYSLSEVHNLTNIDLWFLSQIEDLVREERALKDKNIGDLKDKYLLSLKKKGFSDSFISMCMNCQEKEIKSLRLKFSITPVFKRVDACAAEFEATTAYMYSSYDEECESNPTDNKKIMILGGGPNRIGQGIEFDYCCVHASLALREEGYETIMVNCNPETVSTDFDISDRLYFEPLTFEDVMSIIDIEKPHGVIVQYGGQTPLKLAKELKANKVSIIGTSPEAIDIAEDREKFKDLVEKLGLKQPNNAIASNTTQAMQAADEIGYPLVVRPSYVLGGRAMEIVTTDQDLRRYMEEAVSVSNDSPVLLDRFLNDAIEVDIDLVCDGKDVLIGAIMEHIEEAGIHSGDSGCSIPPYTLSNDILARLREQVKQLALELNVIGLMNTQFAIKEQEIFLLEVNPRASRTAPFVSKAIGIQLAKIGAVVMSGKSLKQLGLTKEVTPSYFSVKEAVLPFSKFPEVDVLLGPEMKSTGEVMGIGKSFGEAYFKAQRAAGVILPKTGNVFLSVRDKDKPAICDIARDLLDIGFNLYGTYGTQTYLEENNIECNKVNKVKEGQPHIVDMIKNGEVHLIINTTEGARSIKDSFSIRKEANNNNVCLTTTISGAKAFCKAILFIDNFDATDIQSRHDTIN
ncbi:MAG: carbamoyl-phosphate synthase large subunit [Gammaproteobacteria bacterium]|jgi:carbamoyl-phosphate synthase large subunit|nr:carbamoyl-phosphate synthase large subunit [Gammaproteobacteria bacterium]MBT4462938.1 carbamoyl-phosphate synthase large subunit [Gammaproteobacteria bacterium]MBT4654639.1 carbamoyl-phosphate synthase large subunit [Gammaproteobacteria bacterium]MBT5117050.1 carbamoyl-phosphate synthase large subunit [Gammaproteobacteria bacterium]MBT5761325.1 carbamoyl-phosphate synthase large subunit [Gammaproteobacteria bacterium]